MTVRLPRGVRYRSKIAIGIRMAQCTFGTPPNGIYVDCIDCGRRDAIVEVDPGGSATVRISDERAQRIFEEHGWSVRPTLCPDHASGCSSALSPSTSPSPS